MAVITKEDVTPIYANTKMQKVCADGAHKQYYIKAVEGYVLHDNRLDFKELNPDTMEETTKLDYTNGIVSCRSDYDFTANPFEFYAVLASNISK